jgi:hypothetical protein
MFYQTIYTVCSWWTISLASVTASPSSRPPNVPPKPHGGTNRRARPRSVFNVKLFNGNLESFVKVLVKSGLGPRPAVSPTVTIMMIVTQPLSLGLFPGV